MQAFGDSYSTLSLVCITCAIQNLRVAIVDMSTKLRVIPRYYYNFDAVSSVIGERHSKPVYLTDNARKTLRDLKLSVSAAWSSNGEAVTSNAKRRGIKQVYLTSADGFFHLAVIIIRDRNVKRIIFQHLSNDGGYQTWMILLPVTRGGSRPNPLVRNK